MQSDNLLARSSVNRTLFQGRRRFLKPRAFLTNITGSQSGEDFDVAIQP
jgi:hypothetical protein